MLGNSSVPLSSVSVGVSFSRGKLKHEFYRVRGVGVEGVYSGLYTLHFLRGIDYLQFHNGI